MKLWLQLGILIFAMVITANACGHRYREASTGRSASEVSDLLNHLSGSSSGASSDLTTVLDLIKNNPDSVVYFAEAPGDMGPIHAVAPLDLQYLTNSNLAVDGLSEIRTYFVDLSRDGNHQNALIIEYTAQGQSSASIEVYTNFNTEDGQIVDSEFTSILQNQSGRQITVRSFDVDDSTQELLNVVQLELAGAENGQETSDNLGQISSMEGFSIFF